MAVEHCGPMDVGAMSDDKGPNDRRNRFPSPARSAFEGPFPPGKLRRFPRADLIDLALGRIRWSMREEWSGVHARLLPARPREGRFTKLNGFTRVLRWTSYSDLFIDRSGGFPRRVPDEKNVDWVAMSMTKNA